MKYENISGYMSFFLSESNAYENYVDKIFVALWHSWTKSNPKHVIAQTPAKNYFCFLADFWARQSAISNLFTNILRHFALCPRHL